MHDAYSILEVEAKLNVATAAICCQRHLLLRPVETESCQIKFSLYNMKKLPVSHEIEITFSLTGRSTSLYFGTHVDIRLLISRKRFASGTKWAASFFA